MKKIDFDIAVEHPERPHFTVNSIDSDIGFLHIPKTAGRNLVKAIKDNNITGVSNLKHTPLMYLKEKLSDKFNTLRTFCFVRNPYERYYSACKHSNINVSDIEVLSDSIILGLVDGIEWYLLFDIKFIAHFFTQTHFIFNSDDTPLVNTIYRYEDIKTGIYDMKETYTIDIISSFIIQENLSSDWRTVLSEKTMRNIEKIYARDFELLNYPIEL